MLMDVHGMRARVLVLLGGGYLEVLQWARANGCPWDERTCLNAAADGHLEVLSGHVPMDIHGTSTPVPGLLPAGISRCCNGPSQMVAHITKSSCASYQK